MANTIESLPQDLFGRILCRLDHDELRQVMPVSPRFRRTIRSTGFRRTYNSMRMGPIWHVSHNFEGDNQFVSTRREADGLIEVYMFVFEGKLDLIGVWESSCLFRHTGHGFVIYNIWSRAVYPISYAFDLQLRFVDARLGARVITDHDQGEQLWHCLSALGTFTAFKHNLFGGAEEYEISEMVNDMQPRDVADPLWMVIPPFNFDDAEDDLLVSFRRNDHVVYVVVPNQAALNHLLYEQLPSADGYERRFYSCTEGFLAVVDEVRESPFSPRTRVMRVWLARFVSGAARYELDPRALPLNLIPNDFGRIAGHHLEKLGDLLNLSFVRIPLHGHAEYIIVRFDTISGLWDWIGVEMPGQLEAGAGVRVFCSRLGL